jgi:hypothetical protein
MILPTYSVATSQAQRRPEETSVTDWPDLDAHRLLAVDHVARLPRKCNDRLDTCHETT